MVEVTKKYFSIGEICSKEIQNGRLEVVINGGAPYMEQLLKEKKEGSVGAIVIDCTDFALDEDSIAAELFTPQFYGTIHKLLIPGGGFSQQITKPYYKDAFSERAAKGGFEDIKVSTQSPLNMEESYPLLIALKSIIGKLSLCK